MSFLDAAIHLAQEAGAKLDWDRLLHQAMQVDPEQA